MILIALGSGFGLASVSPWSGSGDSLTTFTVTTAVWLIIMQWSLAARTGVSQADAAKRVDEVIAPEKAAALKVRQAVDAARKAGSYLSIFTGLSMLIGAFIACAAAALGGQQRDEQGSS